MQKLFNILTAFLLLAAGCNTANNPDASKTPPPNVAITDPCPNPSSKPCNGQLPAETLPITESPAQTDNTQQPPPAPTNTVIQSESELSLAVGQTGHPTNADTVVTLQALSANSATITFGCKNVSPKSYTLQLGDGVSLKPDCVTALTLVKLSGTTAVFQVSLVK